jgi:hypothetical protein
LNKLSKHNIDKILENINININDKNNLISVTIMITDKIINNFIYSKILNDIDGIYIDIYVELIYKIIINKHNWIYYDEKNDIYMTFRDLIIDRIYNLCDNINNNSDQNNIGLFIFIGLLFNFGILSYLHINEIIYDKININNILSNEMDENKNTIKLEILSYMINIILHKKIEDKKIKNHFLNLLNNIKNNKYNNKRLDIIFDMILKKNYGNDNKIKIDINNDINDINDVYTDGYNNTILNELENEIYNRNWINYKLYFKNTIDKHNINKIKLDEFILDIEKRKNDITIDVPDLNMNELKEIINDI